ncbi:MAG: hypothetical protein QM687_01695 [Ferruginibacter sp.]
MRCFFIAGLVLFVCSCNNSGKKKTSVTETKKDSVVIPVINKDSLLSATGKSILLLLKNKNYDSLVHYFAAGDSVHFSPYGFIGSGTQTFTANAFSSLLANKKKIVWGDYDGSGEPILLTAKEYLQQFVYNADFLYAEQSAIDSFIKTGNSLNNLKKAYPQSRFIEYHFSGFDKKYGGMDWTSLRLVFKEVNGQYYLQAIVHDQWTI